ncbi:hypothetical protein [Pseudomonas sp. WS 5410]|uniref:hypothetical protein n=1 Tax=Pseudomonas sp. WS 5410 TaxID=2717485 RepID=UPI00147636B0|nr:hypothetical protein [Pseudomonas sp. WS 5410]NMY23496.1 hypothetical protein [Pseudomonas sp. WS 5410]
MPTIVIHGYARVKFSKTIHGVDADEIEELRGNHENLECNIDLEDCTDFEEFENIELTVKP